MQAKLIGHYGTDLDIVNAARVSFDKESTWAEDGSLKPADARLIQYLARGVSATEWTKILRSIATAEYVDAELEAIVISLMRMAQHWVPFTHNYLKFRVGAPYPIRTQAFKHKVGFTESEESRRYISSVPELFIPDYFAEASADRKQGQGSKHCSSELWLTRYREVAHTAIATYQAMIEDGIAPEEARFILPLGCEVHWIWSGNLASFARYVNQRLDPHAQRQSRILAQSVSMQIAPLFPVSWAALVQ